MTGPTGSGKTTTLYTGLLALNSIERKIVTVEDPIEYRLHGITQMQVHEQIGLTFAEFLSAIVRQDPDVIMVGEIRNQETAQVAAQAALLGQAGAVHAAHQLRGRRGDPAARHGVGGLPAGGGAARGSGAAARAAALPIVPPSGACAAELIRRFNLAARCDGPALTLQHPVGCPECRHTGYRGRFAIAEFLTLNAEIEHLIFARADHNRIEKAAIAAGMRPLLQCGIDAVLAGETTMEEVVRSVRTDS